MQDYIRSETKTPLETNWTHLPAKQSILVKKVKLNKKFTTQVPFYQRRDHPSEFNPQKKHKKRIQSAERYPIPQEVDLLDLIKKDKRNNLKSGKIAHASPQLTQEIRLTRAVLRPVLPVGD
jgi:hypothetical protein